MEQTPTSLITDNTTNGILDLYVSKEDVVIVLGDRPSGKYAITINGLSAEEVEDVIRCGIGKWIDEFEPLTP